MKKKIGIWIILIIIGILLLGMLFFAVDTYRIKNDKPPIFAVQYSVLKDGGTTIYIGLGYKIIDYNVIDSYPLHQAVHQKHRLGSWMSGSIQ